MDARYQATLASLYRREARAGIDLKLERVRQVAACLGHPQRNFAVIHVAGTNGKGSTAATIAAVLSQAGYRVGLYTSPHLVSFRERIIVGGDLITPEEVVEGVAEVDRAARLVLRDSASLTFFEVSTLLAFLTFVRRGVKIAVVEVGLGGRLDATNIVQPEVVVITPIALDHEQFLGWRLELVASEKASVMKRGRPVITAPQEEKALEVLTARARSISCDLRLAGRDFCVEVEDGGRFSFRGREVCYTGLHGGLGGGFHLANTGLALAALEVIGVSRPISEDAVRTGLARLRWAGRLQTVCERPEIILDGAHNPAAAGALRVELERSLGNRGFFLLFGAMKDKRWRTVLSILLPRARAVVLTRAAAERSAEPEIMAGSVVEMGYGRTRVLVEPEPNVALDRLLELAGTDGTILVTGSLRLVGHLLPRFDHEFAALRDAEDQVLRRMPVG